MKCSRPGSKLRQDVSSMLVFEVVGLSLVVVVNNGVRSQGE